MNGLGSAIRHTIVSLDGRAPCRSRVDPGVEVEYVDGERGRWGPLYPLYLGGRLKRLEADLYCTYNWGAMDASMGLVLRRVRPWIQVMDGFANDEAVAQVPRRLFLRRRFYRRAAGVLVVSQVLARIARQDWGVAADRVLYLENGIDTEHHRPGAEPELRARLGLRQDQLVVGSVAHVRGEKNPARLLRGFARIAEEFPDARLVYVGDTPGAAADACEDDRTAHERIMDAIAEHGLEARVQFTGGVEDAAPYYRMFDVFALSSNTEQMPLSVAEAMASARPVLSTDVGDVKRMVCELNRDFVVKKDDEDRYGDALAVLLRDDELRHRIGAANREHAVEHFRRADMIEAYRALYTRLIGSS